MRIECGWAVALAAALAACQPEAERAAAENGGGTGAECRIVRRSVALDADVPETSGAAFDPRDPERFWTHNDSGHDPDLFLLDTDGQERLRVRVEGARNRDWEDLDVGPCPGGGTCLYVADVGDSGRGRRDPVDLYVVPLPALDATATAPAVRHRARFPGGMRDTEAVFVLPDGSVYLINKGNKDPIELWRWPTPLEEGPVELERVRALAPRPSQTGDRVTGAGASPDGRWVAVRTYGRLALYRTAELLGDGGPAFTVDLVPLGEAQGEAVALGDDGTVLLTSEEGVQGLPPRATWLQCALE